MKSRESPRLLGRQGDLAQLWQLPITLNTFLADTIFLDLPGLEGALWPQAPSLCPLPKALPQGF